MNNRVKKALLLQVVILLCVVSVSLPALWFWWICDDLPSGTYPLWLILLPALPCFWLLRVIGPMRDGIDVSSDGPLGVMRWLGAWSPTAGLILLGCGLYAYSGVDRSDKAYINRLYREVAAASAAIRAGGVADLMRALQGFEGWESGRKELSRPDSQELLGVLADARAHVASVAADHWRVLIDAALDSKDHRRDVAAAIGLMGSADLEARFGRSMEEHRAALKTRGCIVRMSVVCEGKSSNSDVISRELQRGVMRRIGARFPQVLWSGGWPFDEDMASADVVAVADVDVRLVVESVHDGSETLGVPVQADMKYVWQSGRLRDSTFPGGDVRSDGFPAAPVREELALVDSPPDESAPRKRELLELRVTEYTDKIAASLFDKLVSGR